MSQGGFPRDLREQLGDRCLRIEEQELRVDLRILGLHGLEKSEEGREEGVGEVRRDEQLHEEGLMTERGEEALQLGEQLRGGEMEVVGQREGRLGQQEAGGVRKVILQEREGKRSRLGEDEEMVSMVSMVSRVSRQGGWKREGVPVRAQEQSGGRGRQRRSSGGSQRASGVAVETEAEGAGVVEEQEIERGELRRGGRIGREAEQDPEGRGTGAQKIEMAKREGECGREGSRVSGIEIEGQRGL